jgi:peroxidase
MLDGWRVEMHCGTDEVLAPAKALTNDQTIRRVEGGTVTYVHIAFDTHEIVMAEGIASESFSRNGAALYTARRQRGQWLPRVKQKR